MTETIKQRILAFICGDALVTMWLKIGGIMTGITQMGIQVISVVVLGIAGGIAGMAGKDIYAYGKAKIKELKKIK